MILFWRRNDVPGLERLVVTVSPDEIVAESTVVCLEDGGFRLDHRWRLTRDWRARSLEVERWGAADHRRLVVERSGDGWRSGWLVDGEPRPNLDGAEEPDLSVTPFCNTFPIRRTPTTPGDSLTLDTCHVDAATMTVQRSRQRYERLRPNRVRYVDLGVASGFEADLEVDDDGLVLRYEHLFERVQPTSPS
ncbi:putative glycolipid-binding domain-containing protein [Agromyces sp. NPDC049794]|uniref:putative glycolipid-binding domain-containing protein n=1 Tax=unclassified Agromyces TaxID=2639701 RepID=UPI0033E5B374